MALKRSGVRLPSAPPFWIGLVSLLAFTALVGCSGGAQPATPELPANTPTPITAPTTAPPELAATSPTSTPERSPTAGGTPVQPTEQLSITVAAVPDMLPEYDRDEWRHWIDVDNDCQNARHEVLIEESQIAVTYTNERQCLVAGGQWFGAFTGATVTEARKLDVDHFVPLANAHRSGGWDWSADRKRLYANSLDNPAHLIAVTASANRSKGARGPDEWRPPDQSYWCDYAVNWISIKQIWQLTATRTETEALQEMLQTCPSPPQLTITEN